jgi:hypothetical protein
MEPFSLGVTALRFAGTAKDVAWSIFSYIQEVKDAEKEAKALHEEIRSTGNILEELHHIMTTTPPLESTKSHSQVEFRKSLEGFNELLEELRPKVQLDILRRLKWPFKGKQNQKYLERMQRYKENFKIVQGNQTLYERKTHSNLIARSNLIVMQKAASAEKRRKIIDWLHFGSRNSAEKHEKMSSTKIEGGEWFVETNDFKSWNDGTGSPCLYCIGKGMPPAGSRLTAQAGVGKSILL